MTSSCNHVVPGEHVYDGVMYPGLFPARILDQIKSFEFRDDDVILATYPKSGEYWLCCYNPAIGSHANIVDLQQHIWVIPR